MSLFETDCEFPDQFLVSGKHSDGVLLGGFLRYKFTEKKLAFLIISIDAPYLQESVVQRKKFEKKFCIPIKLKNRKNFSLKIHKALQDFDSPFRDFSHECY